MPLWWRAQSDRAVNIVLRPMDDEWRHRVILSEYQLPTHCGPATTEAGAAPKIRRAKLDKGGQMSYSDWMRKRWYVLLICVGLAVGLMSVVGDLYCYPLGRHSIFLGSMLGWGVTYLIYLMEEPAE